MELVSINTIAELKEKLKEKISHANKNLFKNDQFGHEQEYSYRGLLGGAYALVADVGALVKAPEKFLRLSSYGERQSIIEHLFSIIENVENPEILANLIDKLKASIRSFNVRYTKDRYIEFDKAMDSSYMKKIEVENLASAIESLKKEAEVKNDQLEVLKADFEAKIKVLEEKGILLDEQLQKQFGLFAENQSKISEFESVSSALIEINKNAEISFSEIKSNEKLIDSFVQRVQTREAQIDKIENQTTEYLIKLNEFETERDTILVTSNKLIESAKVALNYKTAEGLSASFNSQYNEQLHAKPWSWMIGASICLLSTICLGVWILSQETAELGIIIGRITLLPLPIAGAVFCANQYVKRYNIIQDYAYKMALSKSIVGFSEQLKNSSQPNCQEYTSYITKVLDEIHQDPLRKHSKETFTLYNKKQKEKGNLNSIHQITELIGNAIKINAKE